MAFKDSFRFERIYFERLKTMIPLLKSYLENAQTEEARTLLENSVDVDGAVLLLYRNLGEAWAELADLIQKLRERLDEEHDLIEQYHDELNEKIDEVNNYIMAIIREILGRLDVIEADLASMNRVKFLDLVQDPQTEEYSLQLNGETVDFDDVSALVDFPHLVIIREDTGSGIRYYYQNDADPYSWDDIDLSGQTAVVEKTVSIDSVNGITVAENKHQEFYLITATYAEPMPGGDYYRMRHDGNVITVTDIETAIAAGKIPVFVYTVDNTGKTEIFNYNLHSNGFVQFENIQRRVDEDSHSYYVNTTFSAQGNFAAYAENELGKIYTAGTGIEITENNVINNTMEPCCGRIQISLGEVIYGEKPDGTSDPDAAYLPVNFSGLEINKINYSYRNFSDADFEEAIGSIIEYLGEITGESLIAPEDYEFALQTLAFFVMNNLSVPWWYFNEPNDAHYILAPVNINGIEYVDEEENPIENIKTNYSEQYIDDQVVYIPADTQFTVYLRYTNVIT